MKKHVSTYDDIQEAKQSATGESPMLVCDTCDEEILVVDSWEKVRELGLHAGYYCPNKHIQIMLNLAPPKGPWAHELTEDFQRRPVEMFTFRLRGVELFEEELSIPRRQVETLQRWSAEIGVPKIVTTDASASTPSWQGHKAAALRDASRQLRDFGTISGRIGEGFQLYDVLVKLERFANVAAESGDGWEVGFEHPSKLCKDGD